MWKLFYVSQKLCIFLSFLLYFSFFFLSFYFFSAVFTLFLSTFFYLFFAPYFSFSPRSSLSKNFNTGFVFIRNINMCINILKIKKMGGEGGEYLFHRKKEWKRHIPVISIVYFPLSYQFSSAIFVLLILVAVLFTHSLSLSLSHNRLP